MSKLAVNDSWQRLGSKPVGTGPGRDMNESYRAHGMPVSILTIMGGIRGSTYLARYYVDI